MLFSEADVDAAKVCLVIIAASTFLETNDKNI